MGEPLNVYMSTHSLTFSTPEMTLKKFALWLGDQVNVPGKNKTVLCLLMYINDVNNQSNNSDFLQILMNHSNQVEQLQICSRISHRITHDQMSQLQLSSQDSIKILS